MQARIYDTTSISFPVPNPCFLHAAYVIIHEERYSHKIPPWWGDLQIFLY